MGGGREEEGRIEEYGRPFGRCKKEKEHIWRRAAPIHSTYTSSVMVDRKLQRVALVGSVGGILAETLPTALHKGFLCSL